MKRCSKCKEIKEDNHFIKDKRATTGIRIICDAMNMALSDWGEEVLLAVVTSWINKRNGTRNSTVDEDAKTVEENNIHPSIDHVQA